MQVPALVSDAVRLGEYLDEEIPAASSEKVERPLRSRADSSHETVDEVSVALRRAAELIARPRERMRAKRREDSAGQICWMRLDSKHGIVTAPFDGLNSIEASIDGGERHVEHRHSPSGTAQMSPEWFSLDQSFFRRTIGLIRSWPQLNQVV